MTPKLSSIAINRYLFYYNLNTQINGIGDVDMNIELNGVERTTYYCMNYIYLIDYLCVKHPVFIYV